MKISIGYGLMSPDIQIQLKEQGFELSDKKAKLFEETRKNINFLRFNIDLPDGEYNKLLTRLHKCVINNIKPIEELLK